MTVSVVVTVGGMRKELECFEGMKIRAIEQRHREKNEKVIY